MHILLTNDDSYDSPLFHILYDVLKQQGHNLTCIMPATEQSWKSKSMTRFGKLKLEEQIILAGQAAGLKVEYTLINNQTFTKTANCWGVRNNTRGTNSNRIVVFRK